MSKLKDQFKETKNNLKMSWKFIRKKKKSLIFISILSIILSGISIVLPVLSAQLLLKLTNGLLEELLAVSIFIFIVEVFNNILYIILNKITQVYMIQSVTDLKLELFCETLKISICEIDKNSSGTFIDRIRKDTNEIIDIFSNLIDYFVRFISNIGILIAVGVVSPYMLIYFVITALIISSIDRKRRTIYYEESKKYQDLRERSTGLTTEFIRGIRDLKLLNGKNGILEQIKKEMDLINEKNIFIEKTNWKFRLLTGNIRDFFDVIFILLGIFLVSNHHISVANLLVLHMYRGKIQSLLNFYNRIVESIQYYNLSATRVFELLGDHFLKEDEYGVQLDHVEGKIEFRNV